MFGRFPSLMARVVGGKEGRVRRLGGASSCVLFFNAMSRCGNISLLVRTCSRGIFRSGRGLMVTKGNERCMASGGGVVELGQFVRSTRIQSLFAGTTVMICPCHSTAVSNILSLTFCFEGGIIVSSIPFFGRCTGQSSLFFGTKGIRSLTSGLRRTLSSNDTDAGTGLCPRFCSRGVLRRSCVGLCSSPTGGRV